MAEIDASLYCHVCGSPLVTGGAGFSDYPFACPDCQTAYRLEAAHAVCLLPGFVEHHHAPIYVPVAHLRQPTVMRHPITSGGIS